MSNLAVPLLELADSDGQTRQQLPRSARAAGQDMHRVGEELGWKRVHGQPTRAALQRWLEFLHDGEQGNHIVSPGEGGEHTRKPRSVANCRERDANREKHVSVFESPVARAATQRGKGLFEMPDRAPNRSLTRRVRHGQPGRRKEAGAGGGT